MSSVGDALMANRVRAAQARGRRAAESRMLESCRIERPGNRTWNPSTGDYDRPDSTVVYAGRCRIKPLAAVHDGDDAGRPVSAETYDLLLPAETAGVDVSDTVVITSTGRRYGIVSVDDSDRNALHVQIVHRDPGTVTYG